MDFIFELSQHDPNQAFFNIVAGGSNWANAKITSQKCETVVARWLRENKFRGFSCCAIKSCYLEETRGFSVARSNEAAPNGPKCNYS